LDARRWEAGFPQFVKNLKKKLTAFLEVSLKMMLQCSQVHGLRDRCGGKDVAEAGVPGMRVRAAGLCVYCLMASSAIAEELGPEQAKAFVVGKLFAYSCFDGTAGMGRIMADGSVVGTIRPGGRGEAKFASLPSGTIKISGNSVCAHLYGLPIEPCFTVQRIDQHSFRGSIAGSGYAYCDFYQRNPHTQLERPPLMNGLY